MTPRDVLRRVRARGANVRVRDGVLVYRGPRGALLNAARACKLRNRRELTRILTREEIVHICVRQIRSGGPCILPIKGLPEPVIALLDGAPDDFERDELLEGLEVWRISELRELRKMPVAEREFVAEVRRVFEGVLLPSSDEEVPDGPEA